MGKMARRPSRRIDLLQHLVEPDADWEDPALIKLQLEIAIRKGLCLEFPFSSEVQDDVAALLGVTISKAVWMKVNVATARYMVRSLFYADAPSNVSVRNACEALLAATDTFL